MKNLFLLITLTIIALNGSKAQKTQGNDINVKYFDPPDQEIEQYVKDSVQKWQQKGRFETTKDYKKRVNAEARKELVEELTQKKVNEVVSELVDLDISGMKYDADNEIFKLNFHSVKPIYVKVPLGSESKSFYKNSNKLSFRDPKYTITSNDKIALLSLSIVNNSNREVYYYDNNDSVQFKKQEVNTQFGKVTVNVTNKSVDQVREANENIEVGTPDVDKNIPKVADKQSNTFALIIGNENYTKYQSTLSKESNVDFAKRDARVFAKYCRKTLGIPRDNIRLDTNIISSQMSRQIEWLISRTEYGGPDVKLIFYYSGHGFPDQDTKKKYLMPVDLTGSQVKQGFHLGSLYDQLTEYKSEHVTMFLDACFSGAGREKGLLAAKGVKVEPKENAILNGNLVAFSSSQGDQQSFFYKEKKHGLFTYYLLKKLKQTEGAVTYGALHNYLSRKVPLKSTTLKNVEQVPEVNFSQQVEEKWKNWQLK